MSSCPLVLLILLRSMPNNWIWCVVELQLMRMLLKIRSKYSLVLKFGEFSISSFRISPKQTLPASAVNRELGSWLSWWVVLLNHVLTKKKRKEKKVHIFGAKVKRFWLKIVIELGFPIWLIRSCSFFCFFIGFFHCLDVIQSLFSWKFWN